MPTPSDAPRRLRCRRCGWYLEVTADELLLLTRRQDWPRCCMLAMALDVDDASVDPEAKTALARTPRGPDWCSAGSAR